MDCEAADFDLLDADVLVDRDAFTDPAPLLGGGDCCYREVLR